MRNPRRRQAKPISVKLLILLNLLLAGGSIFMALAAYGAFNEQLGVGSDTPSPLVRPLMNYGLNSSGDRALKPLVVFVATAGLYLFAAFGQLLGKGIGWTSNALLAVLGIVGGLLYTLIELRQPSDGPVLFGPLILGLALVALFLLVEPNTQRFFGRFDARD